MYTLCILCNFHKILYAQALHNAICLITAWRKIRLGFMIMPMQLVNPNQVQMLMLVVYLFQTLPTYVPRAKVCTKFIIYYVTLYRHFLNIEIFKS